MLAIYPSLISADLLNLQHTMLTLSPYSAGWHVDIMDNHFVPNLTWGAQFANAIGAISEKPVWVHLMIEHPTAFLASLTIPADSYVSFHIETKDDVLALIAAIRAKKWRPSIAISPKTPINQLFGLLRLVDQIVIMSVNPGHSGQSFIPDTYERITTLVTQCAQQGVNPSIACDGGINRTNIMRLLQAGATEFAIAHGIFGTTDPQAEAMHLAHLNQIT